MWKILPFDSNTFKQVLKSDIFEIVYCESASHQFKELLTQFYDSSFLFISNSG